MRREAKQSFVLKKIDFSKSYFTLKMKVEQNNDLY